MIIASIYVFILSIIYQKTYTQFPDITFDYTSTQQYNGNNHTIGWIQFATCTEGTSIASIPLPSNGWNIKQLQNISQYAITIKILTGNDIPGSIENQFYAVTADICSNPIYALNNGYELSYTLNITDSTVIGASDIN
eukprot:423888_1